MQEDSKQPRNRWQPNRSAIWLGGLGLLAIGLISAVLLLIVFFPGGVLPSPGVIQSEGAVLDGNDVPVVLETKPPATIVVLEEEDSLIEPTPTLAAQAGGRTIGDPYIPGLGNTGYDVQHYNLRLTLDPQIEFLKGIAKIKARSTHGGLSEISLDFTGFQIDRVLIDNHEVGHRLEEKKMIVQLPANLSEGQEFTLEIAYQGSFLREPSTYVQFLNYLGMYFPDGESIYTLAEPDGARYWYPANDHPRDKATYRIEAVVPAEMTAVANGRLVETHQVSLPNGKDGRLFIWEHDLPMAPYLALLAVGEYEYLEGQTPDGVPLRHYIFPELKESFLEATADVGLALDWMSQLLGPYPFEEFGYVTTRAANTSMEGQTMVLLSENMMGPRTAVHELAHMWFGDWVSLDSWSEMWRNEGLATYFQLMWDTGDDPEALSLQMESVAAAVEENEKEYDLNDPPAHYLFEFNVYQKGALVAHALRGEIGDDAFFGGLRRYFDLYGGGTASDAQFQAVMEEAVGRSLEPFFAEWFSTP